MEKEKLESLLIDYIDGNLTAGEQRVVENMLANDEAIRLQHEQLREVMRQMDEATQPEPSPRMASSFQTRLQEAIREQHETKVITFHTAWYRVAAVVALFIVGGGTALWVYQYQQQQQQLADIKNEMARTKQTLMAMLGNDFSASQRVQGATVAYTLEEADDEIVEVLARTLREDPNTNVRLAALEALGKFKHEPAVRKVLIESLTTQKDPIVQITLIRMLVDMKEKRVVESLRRITTDNNNLQEVKDEAHAGLLKLS